MSRRGNDARARDRRHRAAVALRSQTSLRSDVDRQSDISASDEELGEQGHAPPVARTRPRRARPRRVDVDVDPLRELVVGRNGAAVAVDVEVRRLRQLGAGWPEIAEALGVSRQAAREKYKR